MRLADLVEGGQLFCKCSVRSDSGGVVFLDLCWVLAKRLSQLGFVYYFGVVLKGGLRVDFLVPVLGVVFEVKVGGVGEVEVYGRCSDYWPLKVLVVRHVGDVFHFLGRPYMRSLVRR